MKRVLVVGEQKFIDQVKAIVPTDQGLFVCYATSTTTVPCLIEDKAVDLIVIDLTSIPQEDIDHIIGSPRLEDVDATAEYQEPEVDVPDGVEFYAFNSFNIGAIPELLQKLREK